MLQVFAASGFVALLISLGIALFSRKRFRRTQLAGSQPSDRIEDFLFADNSRGLAASSNIGSVLSVGILFSAVISSTAGWGLTALYGVATGFMLGHGSLLALARKLEARRFSSSDFPETLTGLLPANAQKQFRLQILAFYFCVLTLELSVARRLLESTLRFSTLSTTLIIFCGVLLCASYSSLGGFRGILRTDFFQLLVFIVGTVLVSKFLLGLLIGPAALPLRKEYFQISSLPLLCCSAATGFLFAFSWPDLWTRNFGTLSKESWRRTSPLLLSAPGLGLACIPGALYGIRILAESGHVSRSLDLTLVTETLSRDLDSLGRLGQSQILWWIFGSFACILISSLDTYLLGFAQHLNPKNYKISLPTIRIAILAFALTSSLFSFLAGPILSWLFGAIASLILGGSGLVLVAAAISSSINKQAQRIFYIYYSVAGCLTLTFFLLKIDSIFNSIFWIPGLQFSVFLGCTFALYSQSHE